MKLFAPRAKKVLIVVVIIVASVGYGITRNILLAGTPKEFDEARLQGAIIGQSIVDLSNGLSQDLGKINELDKEYNFAAAYDLTSQTALKTKEIKQHALQLSEQLKVMTAALPNIRSDAARDLALQSITQRLELINRLLAYSSSVNDLLNTLQAKFLGTPPPEGEGGKPQTVGQLIETINAQVTAINAFNKQATQSSEAFDQLMRGGK